MVYDREVLIRHRVQRGRETAEEAKLALDNDRLNLAENRIYYAMFYMVQALAIKHDFKTSKHAQLLGWFNKEFVRAGRIEEVFGNVFHSGFEKRRESDYDDFVTFEIEEVQRDFCNMNRFLDVIEALIQAE